MKDAERRVDAITMMTRVTVRAMHSSTRENPDCWVDEICELFIMIVGSSCCLIGLGLMCTHSSRRSNGSKYDWEAGPTGAHWFHANCNRFQCRVSVDIII